MDTVPYMLFCLLKDKRVSLSSTRVVWGNHAEEGEEEEGGRKGRKEGEKEEKKKLYLSDLPQEIKQ